MSQTFPPCTFCGPSHSWHGLPCDKHVIVDDTVQTCPCPTSCSNLNKPEGE